MIYLTLNIRQQAASSDSKEFISGPLVAEFLFHQNQPRDRIFSRSDATFRITWLK